MEIYDPLPLRRIPAYQGHVEGVPYDLWDGTRIGGHLGIDVETTLITGHEVPQLVVLGAFNGQRVVFVDPFNAVDFFRIHEGAVMVAHNAAFDVAVLSAHGVPGLFDSIESGQVRCSMILDQLLCIADGDVGLPRDLAKVAAEWARMSIRKDDPFRLRFGELVGADWSQFESGFFSYLALDCIACYRSYAAMAKRARELMNLRQDEILPDAIQRWGLLTERTQLKARCVFDWMTYVGVCVNVDQMEQLRSATWNRIHGLVEQIEEHAGVEIFQRYVRGSKDGTYPAGDFKRNKSGLPCKSLSKIRELVPSLLPVHVEVPRSDSGLVSLDGTFLNRHRDVHPLIGSYCDYISAEKQYAFLQTTDPVIHPRYGLTRTGRSNCARPNLQQLPRNEVRHCIVPRDRHIFVIADFGAVELATLGAICRRLYGRSVLADTIENGVDPHAFTAAKMLGITIEELKQREDYKQKRQAAKAVNFGVPGGLGVTTLCLIGQDQYGVRMSQEEAEQFKSSLITEIYPELESYLRDREQTSVVSITGRIRGTTEYCQQRNFGFQALAADLGKESLWRLWRAGYRPILFVHDEIVTEVPTAWDLDFAFDQIVAIMKETAREFTLLPVEVEAFASTCWTKFGELIRDEHNRIVPWSPQGDGNEISRSTA